jgi:Cu-Zn family superoxide dismutase
MKNTILAFTALALFAVALANAAETANTKVELKDAQGKSVGAAVISQKTSGVAIRLDLHGLPPGVHAIHFHQNASCTPPDFKSAGPHFNPDNKKHGFLNPEGHHAGDMNNFTVDSNGSAKATVQNKDVNLGSSLFSNGGTTLIIHAKADDMKTDPAGNSGDRIACGVISK